MSLFSARWGCAGFPDTGPTDPGEIIDQLVAARAAKVQGADTKELLDSLDGVDRTWLRAQVQAELTEEFASPDDA